MTRQDIICSTALQFKKERSIFINMEDINVKDKKLFEVELLGIRTLFTTMHIDKSSIPEGMYYYNLKHDGDDRYPSAVENDSAENYFGAVLTVERLDFQAKSFLPLGHDDFCFTDGRFYAEDADMIGSAGQIDRKTIEYFIPETFTQKSYELSKLMLSGKNPEMIRLASRLVKENGENRIGLLSLVLSQIRICYKASLFPEMPRNKIPGILGISPYQLNDAYSEHSAAQYAKAYASLQRGVNNLKSGSDADSAFMMSLISAAAALHPREEKEGRR